MKIGENEITEEQLAQALKSSGKRVVDLTDYESKASAANDLTKFRSLTNDQRSVEEIAKALEKLKKIEEASRSKEELLEEKLKEAREELKARNDVIKQTQLEVQKRDIRDAFSVVMGKEGVKVIPTILEKHMAPFYGDPKLNELSKEDLTKKIEDAARNAFIEQKEQLAVLGIKVDAPSGQSYGSGGNVSGLPGGTPQGGGGLFEILKETSTSSGVSPLMRPKA